ncbi:MULTISPECIES: CDP-alcohol phosphatidyltransferase family protein [Pseudonocardia]|uniref:CDP-alcohol phosphatidyltransferase n=1 Tax=Pseudonocardia dioxanivorans (strain ATCC 55486 / DSM 44775 / JCM 13855 / CB1190) TaxID=675635 RepID=F4CUG5_PSEUX|nr:CDP-alcohol phosphatidyltransferase family protein [Pseudonocardia dioxanivorans]AEA25355.1 CDP-alcohol phosphatidyltransferase [Pseudonocardia dioxanivorans CB1190]GJF02321.1 CDP-diacylglycerol--glycerol-3-phosphate 3-phosphatidyltransferase [Pseudonocardia sp. D17]
MSDASSVPSSADRVLTVPNALSVLRLLGVPLFLYLLLGPHADGWAILVLAVGGVTDWLDGKLARLLDQYSRLGAVLDPAVDRLYILAALLALGFRDVVPWWAVILLVARDVVLGLCLPVLRRRGYGPFVVTYLGKAATFQLLYAFPLLLLGQGHNWFADLARPFGYAFAGWGVALYLWSGLLYLAQFVKALRTPVPTPTPTPTTGPGAGPAPSGTRARPGPHEV